MNKFQSFVKDMQRIRRFNLLGKELELCLIQGKLTKQARKDIKLAQLDNEETDKELVRHFDYSVEECIKLGIPF